MTCPRFTVAGRLTPRWGARTLTSGRTGSSAIRASGAEPRHRDFLPIVFRGVPRKACSVARLARCEPTFGLSAARHIQPLKADTSPHDLLPALEQVQTLYGRADKQPYIELQRTRSHVARRAVRSAHAEGGAHRHGDRAREECPLFQHPGMEMLDTLHREPEAARRSDACTSAVVPRTATRLSALACRDDSERQRAVIVQWWHPEGERCR